MYDVASLLSYSLFQKLRKGNKKEKADCLHDCRPTRHKPAMGFSPRIPQAEPAEIKLILILIIITEGTYGLVMRT
jgi:hypothetical protein